MYLFGFFCALSENFVLLNAINLEKDKIIDLKMLAQEDKLIIKIKNNTNGKVNNENGVFKTTKTSGIHGIGLSQINDIIKKHNGYIKRSHENNVFNTNIMINY